MPCRRRGVALHQIVQPTVSAGRLVVIVPNAWHRIAQEIEVPYATSKPPTTK
jgi:hypothetical protein